MSALKDAGAALWAGVLALIVILILVAMAVFGFGFFSQKSADFRGETSKRNQVEGNGSFRIAAYDSFYNECAGIQATEATINALRDELATKPSASRVEQIHAFITANVANRNSSIAQYNADARKSYTAGQFRSSDLPFQLDPTVETTTCHA